MTPADFLRDIVDPSLTQLSEWTGLVSDDRARVLVMAIAGQESGWEYRQQIGGPARSFWQFEQGGGVAGVLQHPASRDKIRAVCKALNVPCTIADVYAAMAYDDVLGCCMARLLLWTDLRRLPDVGDESGAWGYYASLWRPGMPRPETWSARYDTAVQLVIPKGT